jgi:pantetheine-phosphate adenylyltransferase
MKACYPGTFDPLTNGHMDIIERAASIADELIVAIMVNPDKRVLFSVSERIDMIKEAVQHLPNVAVVASEGLTVDLCRRLGANVLIRGIRAVMDYEYEHDVGRYDRIYFLGGYTGIVLYIFFRCKKSGHVWWRCGEVCP